MRILIAEDDLTSRKILAGVLRKIGHEVVETVDGLAAWTELQKTDGPKLAILDWMMPEMEGLDVVRKVRAGGADVFLDCYAAKSKLLLYSNGLFAPKDIFILFSLYQCR